MCVILMCVILMSVIFLSVIFLSVIVFLVILLNVVLHDVAAPHDFILLLVAPKPLNRKIRSLTDSCFNSKLVRFAVKQILLGLHKTPATRIEKSSLNLCKNFKYNKSEFLSVYLKNALTSLLAD